MFLDKIYNQTKHLKWVFFFALALLAFSYWMKDSLPGPGGIDPNLLKQPGQRKTMRKPFNQAFDGKVYEITPRYQYELHGLVVSARDLDDTWYNIDYDRDPFNIKDLCVIWGGNLMSDDYSKVKYDSGLWTCYIKYGPGVVFNGHELSNNHLLPGNEEVGRVLEEVGIGDQIRLKGYLVDYVLNGKRGTSTVRTDKGNGACEVVYLEEFEIIHDGNQIWDILYSLSKYLMLAVVLVWIYFNIIFTPPHLR